MEMIQLSLFFMLCMVVHRSSSEILQRQKRSWIIDSFTIDEGYTGSFPYSLGTIKVEKDLSLFEIKGQGVDEDPIGILQINRETGEITVHGPVDYEKYKVFKIIFQAFDKEKHILDTQLGVEIQIKDSNDNPPKFDSEWQEISIKESTVQGTDLTIIKASDGDTNKKDATFVFRMVSVTPTPHDLEFYLNQKFETQTATISFRGCLDHERAEKYTIVVEAKDQGEKIQLSSSCTIIINIEDGNNHLPLITGQTGPGKVKEGEENVLVTRLQATDKDTKGTEAWRAKYQIHGDTDNNFRITTDPETNEGLLYLEKALDYEENPLKNITISVENEIPYHSCKVVSRTASGLWKVVTTTTGSTISGTGVDTLRQSTYQMTVTVEDVNEPPIFDKPNKQVTLGENVKAGQYLETFTARDRDTINANTFVYSKGHDPAGWITVDPVTGKITTAKGFDRESAFVNNSIYTVTIHAVDNGKPPMTATATLSIHITDENDNTPTLDVNTIDMCQSHGPSVANITVSDLDEDPYGGPFQFKLHGDVEGKWRVDPPQGYSLNLVKENRVHSGQFKLLVEVFDRQHKSYVHNLSVTVCNCLDMTKPNCRNSATTSTAGGGAIGIIFFGILLLAGALLLAFMVSCNRDKVAFPDAGSGCIMDSNIEKPGTDCKVRYELLNQHQSVKIKAESEVQTMTMKQQQQQQQQTNNIKVAVSEANLGYSTSQMDQWQSNNAHWVTTDSVNAVSQGRQQNFNVGNSMRVGLKYADASSSMRVRDQYRNSMRWRNNWMRSSKYSADAEIGTLREMLSTALTTMLYNLQAPGEELGDYAPHVYAEEGDNETSFELDDISIPDISFEPDFDPDLTLKFNNLASICMPHKSTAYSTETFFVTEKHEMATLIQAENWKTSMITESHL
ncbi:cadherin-like protein 26 isoform X2 [Chaetodon auriga]|uniref:cadherin-like protein 26 isoform X2 n=1 Tax=Chaetodon auriga TaxID=39042 RepID=UPI004032AAE4